MGHLGEIFLVLQWGYKHFYSGVGCAGGALKAKTPHVEDFFQKIIAISGLA